VRNMDATGSVQHEARRDVSPANPMPPHPSTIRLLRVVRWVLPLVLAAIAFSFEATEHLGDTGEAISAGFFAEIALFGIAGPVVVALTLTWLTRQVAAYQLTSAALEASNRGLETSVAERTSHLRAATDQLAQANDELLRANANLRQLDQLKSEFVSLVSHQLRGPLTNINGALEIVAQDASLLPPASQRTLQILTAESQRLSHLIQTILDVSRLEAGRLPMLLGPVAIEPLLARTCASAIEAEPGRPLTLSVPPGLPPVWADEVLLGEVARNLIENAIHYSPPGSSIKVSARMRDDMVAVEVLDHGPGVPPDEQDEIFRSFHRVGHDETTVKGYGLGLYFADKLVRAQHGTIRVQSPVWDDARAPGARFDFALPIAGPEPDDATDPDRINVAHGERESRVA
jgi:signal transduction histidine kinase